MKADVKWYGQVLAAGVWIWLGLLLPGQAVVSGAVPGEERPLGRPETGAELRITNRTLGHVPEDTIPAGRQVRRLMRRGKRVAPAEGPRGEAAGRQWERLYWQHRAVAVAREEGVPTWLFLRLIRQESGFNPRAQSPVGAIGLTQLMPETARQIGVNPHDPEQNLRGGARYLRQMLVRFRGHIPSALASYNAGPVAVEAYQRGETRRVGKKIINARRRVLPLPPYRETRQYVAAILSTPDGYRPGNIAPPPALPAPPPPAPRRAGRMYVEAQVSQSGTESGGETSSGATGEAVRRPRTGRSIYIFQSHGDEP